MTQRAFLKRNPYKSAVAHVIERRRNSWRRKNLQIVKILRSVKPGDSALREQGVAQTI
jgi:hypothetical protein